MWMSEPTPVMISVISAESGSIANEKFTSSEPMRTICHAWL